MPLLSAFHAVRDYSRDQNNAYLANTDKFFWRMGDVITRTWDLGFTAFGGPPVHFQIEYRRFVQGTHGRIPWIDEQVYQELFAICQALPGPGSTKMLFCIVLIHAGILTALLTFLIWSLPGAIGMFCLSLGVRQINEVLPAIAYAFLSGLNASTVGIVALAAVQLSEKAIKDQITRILVIFGACAGLCYTALWYFPALIIAGGIATVIWDLWLRQQIRKLKAKRAAKKREQSQPPEPPEPASVEANEPTNIPESNTQPRQQGSGVQRRHAVQTSSHTVPGPKTEAPQRTEEVDRTDMKSYAIPVIIGLTIIAAFFASFIAILVARSVVDDPPRPLDLFANMYLAGTIIFGGGPVVIPLLREYVVQPGWVSTRDFLIGLAIIQAFPGPNFNFAVYLGALAVLGTPHSTVLGAFLGFMGIFTPGITLAVGFQSLWGTLRHKPIVISLLRGINAAAVGLVFTAVYRLWEIGYLTQESSSGQSLGRDPWWVVVTTLTYAGNAWFKVPAPVAIVTGGLLGLCWYGAVGR
ncbi:hypothetical protein LTS17_000733 [Exophiala oligosperma]